MFPGNITLALTKRNYTTCFRSGAIVIIRLSRPKYSEDKEITLVAGRTLVVLATFQKVSHCGLFNDVVSCIPWNQRVVS